MPISKKLSSWVERISFKFVILSEALSAVVEGLLFFTSGNVIFT